jgi:hypothetical protein
VSSFSENATGRNAAGIDATPAVLVGAVAATAAFCIYASTLLPGVDLGDTGGFQAAILWPETSAREAYPLYHALAEPFVRLVSAGNPARGLNLFSAVFGGIAIGLLAFVTTRVAGSAAAGAVAAAFMTVSWTFWTQAVIAEVYTLHLALVGACCVALEWVRSRPSTRRLAVFFALFALGFGHHMTMVLFLVPFAAFLLVAHPRPRQLFHPRIVGLALLLALAGASQYTPNLMAVWTSTDAPGTVADRLGAFWFDVTKADWRETGVFGISAESVPARLAMWAWDLRQQFGTSGAVLAIAGAVRLWSLSAPWAVCLWLAYACTAGFALTYNVGDVHVFFLSSHYLLAMSIGCAVAPIRLQRSTVTALKALPAAVALTAIGYATWRGWETWPAADRHDDTRGERMAARLTDGLDDRRSVLLADLNWQAENAVLYSTRFERQHVAWRRIADVLPYLPFFVADNHGIGRDVVLTARAAEAVSATYGPLFPIVPDDALPPRPLLASVQEIPRGSPYVLCILSPAENDRELDSVAFALETLTGNRVPRRSQASYEVFAGIAGEPPTLYRPSSRPFRESFELLGEPFSVRMDSWLPTDTFRRGGFGHVLHGRRRVLIAERGVSLVWLTVAGAPQVAYAGNVYAPEPRFRIPAPTEHLVTNGWYEPWKRARSRATDPATLMGEPLLSAADLARAGATGSHHETQPDRRARRR